MLSPASQRVSGPWLVVGLIASLLLLTGCGGEKFVTVTGTVLNNQQPIPIAPNGAVQVTLVPDVPPGTPYTTYVGRADATGKFEVLDVPPGKYKVAVEHFEPDPATDKLKMAFSPASTKIIREVDGKTPLTIDLAMP